MAITDIDISEEFTAGAPSIKYTGDMDPNKQMASDPSWGAEWEDIYQDYKIKQIELGQEFISKEEFIDMHRDHGEASPVIGGEETMQVASHEGNDAWMEKRMEQLMDGGMDWASAAKQAQEEARSGNVPEPMATGGRAHFGLGSIFKSVGKAAKKLVKSPIGKAALLGLGGYYLGGGQMFGLRPGAPGFSFGNMPGMGKLFGSPGTWSGVGSASGPGLGGVLKGSSRGLLSKMGMSGGFGKGLTALGYGAGAVAAGMGAQAFENMSGDEINALKNDPAALRSYLKQYHTNTHPDKSPEEVDIWVEQNMYSTGGRVGYADAGNVRKDPEEVVAAMDNELNPGILRQIFGPLTGPTPGADEGASLIEEIQDYKYGKSYPGETEWRKDKNKNIGGYSSYPKSDRDPMSMEDTIKALEAKWDEAVEDDWGFREFDDLGIYEKEDIRRRIELGFDQAKGPGTNTGIMAAAEGGRINFGGGSRGWQAQLKAEDIAQEDYGQEFYSLSNAQQHKVYNKALVEIDDMLSEKADMMRKNEAQGGRIGYAYGPDQTAEAAGIMGQLPVRNNGAGVKELDLRDSGGFIPPVGVKEKADDIPAMLSNNEFVFTADAVKAAGGGSVEKGAQVMYDQMKKLENKVA